MASVGEGLFFTLGLDVSKALQSLENFKGQLEQSAATGDKASTALGENLGQSLKTTEADLNQVSKTLQTAKQQTQEAGKSFEAMSQKWGGALKGLVTSVLAPLTGALTFGAVIKNYFSGVGEVARLTGTYNQKLEAWRKKRALLAKVNKEDLILYKKGREGLFAFGMAMQDLSFAIMRSLAPAIGFITDLLTKFSNWASANGHNIVRVLKIVGTVLTVTLIPAFVKFSATLLASPLTWIIGAVGLLILVIDDLVTYINGGNSAFADFWALFGTGEEISKALGSALGFVVDVVKALSPALIALGTAFASIKIGGAIFSGLSSAVAGFRAALTALTAHPIIAFLTALIGLVLWLKSAWDRAGGDWSKVLDIMGEDLSAFLSKVGEVFNSIFDFFGRLGVKAKEALQPMLDAVGEFFTGVKNWAQDTWNEILNSAVEIFGKMKSYITGAFDTVADFFGFGGDDGSKVADVADKAQIRKTENAVTNNNQRTINQSISVDARGNEEQAGRFVASLQYATENENYASISQRAQY